MSTITAAVSRNLALGFSPRTELTATGTALGKPMASAMIRQTTGIGPE
jgi:hypothetical protein